MHFVHERISILTLFTTAIKFLRRRVLLCLDLVTLCIMERKDGFSGRENGKGELVLQRPWRGSTLGQKRARARADSAPVRTCFTCLTCSARRARRVGRVGRCSTCSICSTGKARRACRARYARRVSYYYIDGAGLRLECLLSLYLIF